MKLKESEQSLVTLANASELVTNVAQCVIGNEVADTFNGSTLTRDLIHNLAQTTFQSSVSKFLGVE